MNPKVSFVVTTYTGYGKFLDETINSILSQTYKDFEIIIVDDCSTDLTPEVVKLQAKKDDRIRYILNECNVGMGLAKNIGIEDSKSDYICCIDSDDLIVPIFLEKHYDAMIANNGDIIYSYMNYFGLANFIEYKKPQTFKQISNFCTTTHSALFKKSDWKEVGGYKDVTLSDWEFWISMCKSNKKFYIIPETLFYYRKHPDAITIKGDIKERMGTNKAVEQVRKCHPDIFNPLFGVPYISLEK